MLMWYSENCFEDLRSVVGPPAATDWSRPWHEILHDWNAPVAQFVQQYSVKCWSVRCVEMHRNLAQYIANPPPDRWLSRILMWTCRGHHTVGRPRNTWDTTLQNFCTYQHLGNWSPHLTSLHFTSLHFTSLHFTSLHLPSLHFTSLAFTSLHFTFLTEQHVHSFTLLY